MDKAYLQKKMIILAVAAATFVLIYAGQQVYGHYWGERPPELCLLAGEGFILDNRRTMIMMDAPFRGGFPEDKLLSEAAVNKIMMAEPPYGRINLITISHKHIDHFDPEALMAHLSRNPGAKLLLPVQAHEEFKKINGAEMFEDQIVAITPERGTPETIEVNGISVTVYNLDHRNEAENIGVLFTMGNKTFFHMGDFAAADFEANGIAGLKVDYLLVPFWYLRNEENFKLIADNIEADYLVPMHLPRSDPPEAFIARVGPIDQLMATIQGISENVLMLNEEGACLRAEG